MPRPKKPFKPPSPIFVIFDTIYGHPLVVYPNRKDLNDNTEDMPVSADEAVVEYFLPKKRTPKSRKI